MTILDTPVLSDSEREHFSAWGEALWLPEWDNTTCYRSQHGWKVWQFRLLIIILSTKTKFNYSHVHFNVWQQGHDLVHSSSSPVRIIEYRVKYGQEIHATRESMNTNEISYPHNHFDESEQHQIHASVSSKGGGVGTTLRGIVNFTSAAESHKG